MSTGVGEQFAIARAAWLRQAGARLEADERVTAVLLTGSLGRGTADDWSDIDLLVVLALGGETEVLGNRGEYVRRFGTAVLVFDSPWNAPLDGAQMNVLYDVGGDWPLYVDWDLWPANRGAISPDVRVVFDRGGLPRTQASFDDHRSWPTASRPDPTSTRLRRAQLAMLPIIAKCLVRGDLEHAHRMLSNLGYPTEVAPADLLAATRTMWNDSNTDADAPLARIIDRMLVLMSEAAIAD